MKNVRILKVSVRTVDCLDMRAWLKKRRIYKHFVFGFGVSAAFEYYNVCWGFGTKGIATSFRAFDVPVVW